MKTSNRKRGEKMFRVRFLLLFSRWQKGVPRQSRNIFNVVVVRPGVWHTHPFREFRRVGGKEKIKVVAATRQSVRRWGVSSIQQQQTTTTTTHTSLCVWDYMSVFIIHVTRLFQGLSRGEIRGGSSLLFETKPIQIIIFFSNGNFGAQKKKILNSR